MRKYLENTNVSEFVGHYNAVRLHSSIGYIALMDKLNGRELEIFAIQDARLKAAGKGDGKIDCRISRLSRNESLPSLIRS